MEEYVAHLLSEGLERKSSYVWDCWTQLCADLGLSRLVPLVKRAVDEELCCPFHLSDQDFIDCVSSGKFQHSPEIRPMIDDAILETESWLYDSSDDDPWSEDALEKFNTFVETEPIPADTWPKAPKPEPRYAEPRGGPKVGRNDPCPCGSGRKFKKCCGA